MNDAVYAKARRNMVDSQLLPNQVADDRIVDAMGTLPRELFVPSSRKAMTYADETIAIDGGRSMMQPMVVARLLEIAGIEASDVVLCVGAGTGYTVAVLAQLAETVVAVESDNALRQKAERTLSDLEIDNAAVIDGDLTKGHPQEAPFSVIVIDGAVPEVPAEIADQLADGGRLVCVEMAPGNPVGRGVLVTRHGDVISKREIFDAVEPLLPGFEKEAAFSF